MAKFVFRLEILLQMRKRLEEAAQKDLAEAMNILEQGKNRLIELEQGFFDCSEQFTVMQQKPIQIDRFQMLSLYIEKLSQFIIEQKNIIKRAEENVRFKLEKLQKAVQQRQIVEKLKEKRFEQYKIELLQEEQKLIDEMGVQRFAKK